jgi:Histidine kinase
VAVHRRRLAQDAAMREEAQLRRAGEERLRLARELHDVLGHHVSLINVQAGVALYLIDDDPEQARHALAAIKGSSRELLREMRSTLGVLRGVDEAHRCCPPPGWIGSTSWSLTATPPGCRWWCECTASPDRYRPAWTSPRSGSCRKH